MSHRTLRQTRRHPAAAVGMFIMFAAAASRGLAQADKPAGPPPTPVRARPVTFEVVQEYRQVTGNLRALARSKVATIEPGLVVECPVEEGDAVKKGDVLAQLDDRRLLLELERIKAQKAVAKATVAERSALLDRTRHDYEALKQLDERRASNPKELVDAEYDVQAAAARKQQAEQDLRVLEAQADLLRTRLADMIIRAPFEGVVVAKETEVGQWVATGEPLVELVSVGRYDAWLDVPQQFAAAAIAPQAKVAVEIRASGQRFEPARPRVVRDVDRIARTFSFVIRVTDAVGRLAPGMSVMGWVPTGRRDRHLMVPRDALMRNQAGFFVYAVSTRGGGPPMALPVQIDVVFEYDDAVAIRPGPLQKGDQVVTEGNERLFPMMAVSVIESAPPGAARTAEGSSESEPTSPPAASKESE